MNDNFISQCCEIVGKKHVLSTPEDLAVYGYDGTFAEGNPDLVVLPENTEQVSRIVKLAAEEKIAIIPRGMGSGMAAGSVPTGKGEMVISLTRMNRIFEIDTENATVHVEAGIITAILQAEVEKFGLCFPPDPSSIRHSTIGGNIACNAGGPHCLKYGVTDDYVLGLTIVLANGQILKTGGKPIKNVTGYDLNSLFTGSEGTLGVITEALLRLVTKPGFTKTALAEFASLYDASRTVNAILMAGVVPASLELMDQTALVCIEQAMHLGLNTNVEASIIIETDGADAQTVTNEIEKCVKICLESGAQSVKLAQNDSERANLWKARRSMAPSLARLSPNKLGEDISVPRSAIPEIIQRLRKISEKYGLPIVIFGHAGDGNLHPNVLFDKRDPEQWKKVEMAVAEIFEQTLEVGGTLSGEHGIGVLKRPYLAKALGNVSMEVQKQIKFALDPHNLMNPGKIFPENS
jgi:glycolate oxidase